MNTYMSLFPFHIEHIGMKRCLVVRDYAASNQIFCRECVFDASSEDEPDALQKLDIVLSQGVVNHLFDALYDIPSSQSSFRMAVQPYEADAFCFHVYRESDRYSLSMIWRFLGCADGRTEFGLAHIYAFGYPKRDVVDLAFDSLEVLRESLLVQKDYSVDLRVDCRRGVIAFDMVSWIVSKFIRQSSRFPKSRDGRTKFWTENNRFHIQYDACGDVSDGANESLLGFGKLKCTSFYFDTEGDSLNKIASDNAKIEDNACYRERDPLSTDPSAEMSAVLSHETSWSIMDQIRAYGMRASCGDENWLLSDLDASDDDAGESGLAASCDSHELRHENRLSIEYCDSECPTVEAIHRAILAHETIKPEVARLAIDEVQKHLPSVILPAFLHFLHLWAPNLGDIIRLNVLAISSEEDDLPVLADILMRLYYHEHNATMLLALLQRMINNNKSSPHGTIRYGLEYVNVLSEEMGMYSTAVKRLESLKSLVQKFGNCNEITAYALACHRAQYSVGAIQFLRSMMKRTQAAQDLAQIGLVLIHIMLEHNEPMQSVINVCKRILVDNPHHMDSLEIMAQCYVRSKKPEDAADAYQECFDYYIQEWETLKFEESSKKTSSIEEKCQYYVSKLIRLAVVLESLYESLGNTSFKCFVLKQHIRLEPSSMTVLSQLLKSLEAMRSYHEMVQLSLSFLASNTSLSCNDEIAIRLTLYNLYDGVFHLGEEAEMQLSMARELSPNDSRVILADIERCRKLGLKDEEIGHRLALIDVLPSKEAVEETLTLVRQFEAIQAPPERIVDLLRRMNGRVPNNSLILLELRRYLRKLGQTFELATVLERLSRVTLDLQTRKTILLEASEVHEKLGNRQVAQALYHEAQLCSPINPNSSLLNDKIRMQQQNVDLGRSKGQVVNMISALASVVLTSKSLSVVGDAVDTGGDSADMALKSNVEKIQIGGDTSDSLPVRDSAVLCLDESRCDENAPIEEQILDARLRGNTPDLLACLLRSIAEIEPQDRPPRVLQEIGCIYFYDNHDCETARQYLEQASALSDEVAHGEQTLNALESIYLSLHAYKELVGIMEKKLDIMTTADERRRYEIRLAQVRFEQLGETEPAIDMLRAILTEKPTNEAALQLLAQIYIDTQQIGKAIEALESVTPILEPNSRQMAQHMLRLIALYIETDKTVEAKRELRRLLDANDFVDKLAVIEHYKRICREHDEWEEQLDVLNDELAYYLKRPKEQCRIDEMIASGNDRLLLGVAEHTLREYADICYYKLQRIDEAIDIYVWLYHRKPEEAYAKRVLGEIAELNPDNEKIQAIMQELGARDLGLG